MTLEVKLIGFLLFVIALGAGGWYLHHEGYEEAVTEYAAKIAQADLAAKTKLDAVNATVAKNQSDLTTALQAITDKSKELQDEKAKSADLDAKYRAGLKRMSVGTYHPTGPAQQNSSAAAPAGTGQDGSVYILPATATAIFDIAGGYSEEVRLKNDCIDRYNAVREAVNK
jgi:ABC-type transporter Mla subunit MlaD